ncbi:MAG: hypothetical protein V3U76_16645 [Granulosicoccus sp.]
MKQPWSIRSLFCFPGFTASATLKGVFGDRYSRIITLQRRKNGNVFSMWAPVYIQIRS